MMELTGKLKHKSGEETVLYKVFETDHKILRVSRQGREDWLDLRPLSLDNEVLSGIFEAAESKTVLASCHGYGMVLCHGIFRYENCDFLVTDAFGGKTFGDYLKNVSIENMPKMLAKDIITLAQDITTPLQQWKNFHGFISSQTVLIDHSKNTYHAGLMCFPQDFIPAMYQDFLRPSLYLKKLTNNQLIADDQYALAIILLQMTALNQGIAEPLGIPDILQKFLGFIKDKEIYRFYSYKLAPYIQKLLNGSVTVEEVHGFCEELAEEIEAGNQMKEYLTRFLQPPEGFAPKLVRNTIYSGFSCPSCGVLAPRLPYSQGMEPCPICKRRFTSPRLAQRKICRLCKNDFDVTEETCPHCSSEEEQIGSGATIEVFQPMIETLEGSGEGINPLTTLPGFTEEILILSESQIAASKQEGRPGRKGKTAPLPKVEPAPSKETSFATPSEASSIEEAAPYAAVQCTCQGGSLATDLKDAAAGKWKFQVCLDEKGENILEERDYVSLERKDLRCTIPLDAKETADQVFVFVLIYKEGEILSTQKVLLDKNKGLLGKMWKS